MINNFIKNIFFFSLVTLLLGQSPDQVVNDGKAQLANNDYEQAEVLFKKALEMDPTFSPAMLELAKINLRFGKMKDTQEFLRQAIDIDPENQEYRDEFNRINEINTLMSDASRYMGDSDYDNAFESYRVVLEKFPLFSEAAFSKGLVRYREKNLEEAVVHFKKALEINPYHEKARTALDNVTKKAFNEANGYEKISHILSGDDDLLLHKINNLTSYRSIFCLNQRAVVESDAPKSIISFIKQRMRSASKSILYYSLDSSSGLSVNDASSISLISTPIASPLITL